MMSQPPLLMDMTTSLQPQMLMVCEPVENLYKPRWTRKKDLVPRF